MVTGGAGGQWGAELAGWTNKVNAGEQLRSIKNPMPAINGKLASFR